MIEDILLEYEKLIYNIAYRIFKNSEDAKDIAQEVCIKIYKNYHKCKDMKYMKTWIYTVTYNTCVDELRKRRGKQVLPINEEIEIQIDDRSPENVIIQKEKTKEIERAIYKLSDEHRTLIVLRDINGLSYDEISKVTKLSLGTVKSRIYRARNNLRQIIKDGREVL